MGNTDLIINNMTKSDANAVIKAIDKLIELGQIEQPNWFMTNEKGEEIDSQWQRVEKQNRKFIKANK